MSSYSWTCPFCEQPTTITESDHAVNEYEVPYNNAYGSAVAFFTSVIICPNLDCKQVQVTFYMHKMKQGPYGRERGEVIRKWRLLPCSSAVTFPKYVPKPMRDDYEEACAILELSPKAAATLARRALQGMIRDFWKVSEATLKQEVEALEGKADPLTWAAIDAVRSIGNIGAHLEKDINVIIDVDPDEADKLLRLIEILVKDWYIARHNREQHLIKVKAIADQKSVAESSAKASANQP